MNKIVAMIPVRMGSTRVPKKNIRLLNGKPLVAWIIEAAKAANCFDEIYLNSEDDFFRDIADQYGIKFYKRPAEMAADTASNDDFMYDFLKNTECETVVQLLATSPFIKSETIKSFTHQIVSGYFGNLETLISVKDIQIECLYKKRAINFDTKLHTKPSQELEPIQAYSCGIMGWKSLPFINKYKNNLGAYHGTGYGLLRTFTLTGYETVDIDNEEDFILAELVAQALKTDKKEPAYYQTNHQLKKVGDIETDVNSILTKDGIGKNNLKDANKTQVNIPTIIQNMGGAPWSHRLVNTGTGSATLICQNPREGNREHYHPDISEWWLIIQGQYEFKIDGQIFIANKNDVIFVKKGVWHQITATGNTPAIRLAVSIDGAEHIYANEAKDEAVL